MKASEQQVISLIPIQFREQDVKINILERRIEALEKLVNAMNLRLPQKVDGRSLRWQK